MTAVSTPNGQNPPRQRSAKSKWGVVVVYDDAAAGKRALGLLQRASRPLGEEFDLLPVLWRADILLNPVFRVFANHTATRVGLVLASASGELPSAAVEWIAERLKSSGHRGVLVALANHRNAAPPGSWPARLRQATAASGWEFLSPPSQPEAPAGPQQVGRCEASQPPAAQAAESPRRVLLIEDEQMVRTMGASALSRHGHQVDTACNCEEGWEMLQSRQYDLVVTDNEMPGMTGQELVRRLRSSRSRQADLPVLFISGGIEEYQLDRARSYQPSAALPKPFTLDQLVGAARDLMAATGVMRGGLGASTALEPGQCLDHAGLNE